MRPGAVEVDPFAARLARRAPALLRAFNDIGVLDGADVHVARRLTELAGERDEVVMLAVALAVRGPRLGHVLVDLASARDTVTVDADEPAELSALPWPEPREWVDRVAASPLVASDSAPVGAAEPPRPLRLSGTRLYLDRYWREELQVAEDLLALDRAAPAGVEEAVLAAGLERLFALRPDPGQRLAAQRAVTRRLAVLAGGPGTGKTTTVALVLALLVEQAQACGTAAPIVALAAPTGKAAARLEEAVLGEAATLPLSDPVRERLLALRSATVHRLLGWRPGSHSRFRHHRDNRLPHDVVVVDETSMVPLSLMARLLEAVRDDARLILLGDPGQLSSIEAGAVLGDIVGPAAAGPPPAAGFGRGIVVLERVHRFGGEIARVADAIRRGDADEALAAVGAPSGAVTWIDADATNEVAIAPVREQALAASRAVLGAARAGEAADALRALGLFRLLCAHRRGPHGVATWTARIERWLADEHGDLDPAADSYPGRPLLVTANDYELQLYNGDTGVIVDGDEGRPLAVFERGGRILAYAPARLGAVETMHAMTIHRSQGSQFDVAAVLLPPPSSRILTRELLYTAVTRARERLILVATEEMIRAAVQRPVARASGLRERLWGVATPSRRSSCGR